MMWRRKRRRVNVTCVDNCPSGSLGLQPDLCEYERKVCHYPPCDCEVGDWTDWGCSAECGTGEHRKTRFQTKTPTSGGRSCADTSDANGVAYSILVQKNACQICKLGDFAHTAQTNLECVDDGAGSCRRSCKKGFDWNHITQRCDWKVCTCEGGVGAEGTECPYNGAVNCASCKKDFSFFTQRFAEDDPREFTICRRKCRSLAAVANLQVTSGAGKSSSSSSFSSTSLQLVRSEKEQSINNVCNTDTETLTTSAMALCQAATCNYGDRQSCCVKKSAAVAVAWSEKLPLLVAVHVAIAAFAYV
ncbi:unnamed protein product [Amoebophrya sp. A120]|nr:unnamed protein product [Amoebophrya sp. A120]|eukprot:GSA120T00025773001.1